MKRDTQNDGMKGNEGEKESGGGTKEGKAVTLRNVGKGRDTQGGKWRRRRRREGEEESRELDEPEGRTGQMTVL